MGQKRKLSYQSETLFLRRRVSKFASSVSEKYSGRPYRKRPRCSNAQSDAFERLNRRKRESFTDNIVPKPHKCEMCLREYAKEEDLHAHYSSPLHQRKLERRKLRKDTKDYFSFLPKELYGEIFSHLPWIAKRSVFLVNKKWNELAKPIFPVSRDIVFVCDTTGSMRGSLPTIKKRLTDFMEQEVKKDSRFALVGYKDHDTNQAHPVTSTFAFSREPKKLIEYFDGIAIGGGGDEAEAVVDGLREALSLNWRTSPSIEKAIVLFCDAPAHGNCNRHGNDSHPNGCPCGTKEQDLLKEMKEKNISFIMVPFADNLDTMIDNFKREYPEMRISPTNSNLDEELSKARNPQ